MTDRTRTGLVGAAAAVFVFLPLARGLLGGRSLYFRDLAGQFFPFRRFLVEGLGRGELRYWNPLAYEGAPISLPPVGYPIDLLQAVIPGEWGLSLILALHVPLAAVSFLVLARGLGISLLGAAGGSVVYALGGYSLSTLNLYVYAQALAWAPLAVHGLARATESRRSALRAVPALAVLTSTLGAEVALQAVVFGVALAMTARRSPTRHAVARLALVGALVAGLVAPLLGFVHGVAAESERAAGFAPDVVLAHSVHPLTLGQVVIGNFHGDLGDVVNLWWGANFFPQGFPYLLSLYLGGLALALAAMGLLHRQFPVWTVTVLGALGLWVSLGRWAGWDAVVPLAPAIFRYPSKAFFAVHLAAALMSAAGLDALAQPSRRRWGLLAAVLLGGGALLAVAPVLPGLAPRTSLWFASGFFPPEYSWSLRLDRLARVLDDARAGGALVLAGGLVAGMHVLGRLSPRVSRPLLVALLASDMLRTGAGLNPSVTSEFYSPSPEMQSVAERLREADARVFTCDPERSPAYRTQRAARARHETWTFVLLAETLSPFANMRAGVASAYHVDRTMFVPAYRVLAPESAGCAAGPPDVSALRLAGVTHVLSIDPVRHPDLPLEEIARPARIAPLSVHVYRLHAPLPRYAVATTIVPVSERQEAERALRAAAGGVERALAVEAPVAAVSGAHGAVLAARARPGRIELSVSADRATAVAIREGYAVGWSARVNGSSVPVWRANGRHLAVPVPGGTSRVVLTYRPPHVRAGLLVAFASALALAVLWRRERRLHAVDQARAGAARPPGHPHE